MPGVSFCSSAVAHLCGPLTVGTPVSVFFFFFPPRPSVYGATATARDLNEKPNRGQRVEGTEYCLVWATGEVVDASGGGATGCRSKDVQ